MSNKSKANIVELVERARLGDEKCLNRLAGVVRQRLCVFIYRLTLEHALTEDIVQETIFEMSKVLGKSRKPDRFWPWLYKIALNKLRLHYRSRKHYERVGLSGTEHLAEQKEATGGLESMISGEVKQIVGKAMRSLRTRHRAVLTMRCYDDMAYSEIAETMGCSEFAARVLFYRAKKALRKQLSVNGFGKGALLTALVLFGKMTAPTEAAMAEISVTSAGTTVGFGAGVVGTMWSKGGLVSLATATILAGGGIVTMQAKQEVSEVAVEKPALYVPFANETNQRKSKAVESWYYYPEGKAGPVMMRRVEDSGCQWLQTEKGNYFFDRSKNTIYINNYRIWAKDLSVLRLPTDNADTREFLSSIEGINEDMEYVRGDGKGLLVIFKRGADNKEHTSQIAYNYNVLDEEFFRYNLPAGAQIVDRRDAIHRRGWTFIEINGEINGERIHGVGQLPLTYEASREKTAWLRLQAGPQTWIIDDGGDAFVFCSSGKYAVRYKGGSFFSGLCRPWMGLHTVDIIRRDAIEAKIRFETRYEQSSDNAEVSLLCEQIRIDYTINMTKDLIEKIEFSIKGARERDGTGVLYFSYPEDAKSLRKGFTEPTKGKSRGTLREEPGILWLLRLAEGTLLGN